MEMEKSLAKKKSTLSNESLLEQAAGKGYK